MNEETRQEIITQIWEDYNSYLHELTDEELELIEKNQVFTIREAKRLEDE